jgi:hypothetical protein
LLNQVPINNIITGLASSMTRILEGAELDFLRVVAMMSFMI